MVTFLTTHTDDGRPFSKSRVGPESTRYPPRTVGKTADTARQFCQGSAPDIRSPLSPSTPSNARAPRGKRRARRDACLQLAQRAQTPCQPVWLGLAPELEKLRVDHDPAGQLALLACVEGLGQRAVLVLDGLDERLNLTFFGEHCGKPTHSNQFLLLAV